MADYEGLPANPTRAQEEAQAYKAFMRLGVYAFTGISLIVMALLWFYYPGGNHKTY